MTSLLVPDFLINPVLRQARRFSSNFATTEPEAALAQGVARSGPPYLEDGISDMEENDLGTEEPVRRLSSSPPAEVGGAGGAPAAHLRSTELDDHEGLLGLHISSPVRPAAALGGDGASQPIDIGRSRRNTEQNVANSLPASFFGGTPKTELPEDDGMTKLRRRILNIQSKRLSSTEKAKLMHSLLMEGYTQSQIARQARLPARPHTPSSPTISEQPAIPGPLDSFKFWQGVLGEASAAQKFLLTEEDVRPTYAPASGDPGMSVGGTEGEDLAAARFLGCEHYRRNIKLQCFTCERWYTCRLCHNDAEDHVLPRKETRHMLCMLCGHAQRVGEVCVKCGESAARYYCAICKLWNDDPDKSIYHCNDCGICRVGEGLGKDFIHCKKCGSCIAITMEASHRCREGAMDCDCPICGEYMFTSHRKVLSMKCGHMIHDSCRAEYIKTSYKCPICSKSVENMESQFRRLDKHLEEQPMPPEYKRTRALILCNDCEAKTSTRYHWGGLKCEVCLSYNTVELQILHGPAMPEALTADSNNNVAKGGIETEANLTPPLDATTSTTSSMRNPAANAAAATIPRAGSISRIVPSVWYTAAAVQPEQGNAVVDSDQEEEMLDLWGRTEDGGEEDEEDDDDEDDEDDEGDDDDDDEDGVEEEETIVLFGHR